MPRKTGQVQFGLEVLEDRMVLSTMGVFPGGSMIPAPSGSTPPALTSPSQLPDMRVSGPCGILSGSVPTCGPSGQLPGVSVIQAPGQPPAGFEQLPPISIIGMNGQLPGGIVELLGNAGAVTIGQLPGFTTTGAKDKQSIVKMKSESSQTMDHNHIVKHTKANDQLRGPIQSGTNGRLLSVPASIVATTDGAITVK
jgi:hypothetical protein